MAIGQAEQAVSKADKEVAQKMSAKTFKISSEKASEQVANEEYIIMHKTPKKNSTILKMQLK